MERSELLELWNDMWKEGNWVPSWPDSLAGLSVAEAIWTPQPNSHCIWQEVVHVTFWRRITLKRMANTEASEEKTDTTLEFALPETISEESWSEAIASLKQTQEAIALAIPDETQNIERIPYHLIHDAYHLGRITQLRAMQGTPPKF